MARENFKRGIIIALFVSILITIPRVIRFEQSSLSILIANFVYIYIINFIYWFFAEYIVLKNMNVLKSLFLYLIITGIFSIFYHYLFNHFFFHFKLLSKALPLIDEINLNSENFILFVRGMLFSGMIYFVVFYLKLLTEKQKNFLEIEQLKKEKLEAQLVSLKQQISPHFLFNSLSTLRTMVEQTDAKKFINKLSDVYRYLLNLNENNLVSLKDEISFTDSYLYILKERFEDALIVENFLPTTIQDRKIPPMVIQLLIENVIKHNEASINKPLKITLSLFDDDSILISNTIQKKISTVPSTGIGLDNIKLRYELLSDKNIIIKTEGMQFIVIIPIL
jgi:two-component system LytT family sensor kinase